MERDPKVKEITYIAMGVAAMIVCGGVIYVLMSVFPIPGLKYVMMAPLLSVVMFILLDRIEGKQILLKVGVVFGLIMTMVNLYMGLAILVTAFLSEASLLLVGHSKKAVAGAVLFSTYTGLSALTISKYMIGGVFAELPNGWILLAGILCLVTGTIGTIMAKHLSKYIKVYSHS